MRRACLKNEMFRPISLESAATLQAGIYYHAFTPSQYSFVNLYTCACKYHYQWRPFNGQVLILNGKDDRIGIPDMRSVTVGDVLHISNNARQQGWRGDFYLMETDFVRAHPNLLQDFTVTDDDTYADYLYSLRAILEMRGPRFERKRNMIARFKKTFPTYTVRPLDHADLVNCTNLFQKWIELKSTDPTPWLAEYHRELETFEATITHYDALRVEGIGVFVEQKMISFIMYNSHCADTVICHFLKYDPTIKGACEIVVWELARMLVETYRYLNFEQDMGIPGLRHFKNSYNPVYKLASFMLIRR